MTTSKLRIKMDEFEVEYEGSEEFLKEELPDLLASVSKLHKESGGASRPAAQGALGEPKGSVGNDSGKLQGTTATFAARLGVKKGGELVIAAAAQLTFVEGKESFTRNELVAACRDGKAYFKKSFVGNLTGYLSTLVSNGQLNEVSADVYAIPASERQALESKLAAE